MSCQKDDNINTDTTNYLKISEVVSSGSSFNVGFYATDSLFVGYNKVYIKITDKTSGQAINQATLVLHPLMDMVTMKHACPAENPGSAPNADGYYEGVIIFSMPGTNSWSVSADVTANGKTETVNFAIPKVIATDPVQKIVVMDTVITGGVLKVTKYPISIVKPKAWKVGMNTFEITINCMQSMMAFPSCSDFTVEITPEMPSMGHGSPNNVNPVHVSNGHYVGSVNFTMTGAWRINMLLKKSDWVKARSSYFDITF
jgi:hypothetical protein